jgi:hypothetical protein
VCILLSLSTAVKPAPITAPEWEADPPFCGGGLLAIVMSGVAAPLWKLFRTIANAIPGSGENRSPSHRNHCSRSARNRVRLQPGTPFAIIPESHSHSRGIRTTEFVKKSEAARRLGVSASMVTHYLRDPKYDMPGEMPNGLLDWKVVERWHRCRIEPLKCLSGSYYARQMRQQDCEPR